MMDGSWAWVCPEGPTHSLPCPPNLFLPGPGLTPPDQTPTPRMLLERQEKRTSVE